MLGDPDQKGDEHSQKQQHDGSYATRHSWIFWLLHGVTFYLAIYWAMRMNIERVRASINPKAPRTQSKTTLFERFFARGGVI